MAYSEKGSDLFMITLITLTDKRFHVTLSKGNGWNAMLVLTQKLKEGLLAVVMRLRKPLSKCLAGDNDNNNNNNITNMLQVKHHPRLRRTPKKLLATATLRNMYFARN